MESNVISSANLDPSAYTDISGLNRLKRAAVAEDPAAIKAVAKQFESLFINMMMKSMREANAGFGEDNPFNSSETKFFQEMLDKEYGLTIAGAGGIGLAKIIEKQLMGRQGVASVTRPEKQPSQGESLGERLGLGDRVGEPLVGTGRVSEVVANQEGVPGVFNNDAIIKKALQNPNNKDQTVTNNPGVSGADTVIESGLTSPRTPTSVSFESPEDFVKQILVIAKSAAKALSIDQRVLVAQAALETGWGQHTLKDSQGGDSFNLFNIKTGADWQGESVLKRSLEYEQGIAIKKQSSFRAYRSFEDSFNDYTRLIQTSPRYQKALSLVNKPLEYINELQKAGYATDPNYGEKISRIFNSGIFK